MKRLLILCNFLFLMPLFLIGQTQHFSWTSNTGNNATIGVLLTTEISVNGQNLQPGDEIGVFTPEGMCVGGIVWTGQSNQALTAWGNNMMTEEKDGLSVGDTMYYRVWTHLDGIEYEIDIMEYSSGSGVYEVNGVYVLSSLIAIPEPEAPLLQTPENNSVDVDPEVTFEWNESEWAETYIFQVANDDSFDDVIVEEEIEDTEITVGLENNTTYYWRVRAVNIVGMSDWSDVWNFTTVEGIPAVPVLVSPPNNASNVSTSPELIWQSASGAETYTLQVATVPSFSSTVVNESGIDGTSFTVQDLEYEETYYWRVRAVNAGGVSDWSAVWSFTTSPLVESQAIVLNTGWNMISSHIEPDETAIQNVFSGVNDPELFVKNAAGDSYWPAFDIFDLTHWNMYEGYEVFVSAQHTLSVQGTKLDPVQTPVGLTEGWSIIPFYPDVAVPVTTALSSIEDQLLIVKDINGDIYWPEYDVNTLGDLEPGQGYYTFLSDDGVLLYPPTAYSGQTCHPFRFKPATFVFLSVPR